MEITVNSVVSFHYRLCDENGTELESSSGGDPALYLHGHRQVVPGVEQAMTGHKAGDNFAITVPPELGYGPHDPEAKQRVPKKHLLRPGKLVRGKVVQINTESGARMATVLKVGHFNVDVDLNHPHAGKTLHFDIQVLDVREATEEELSHGHAHGPGGAHH